MKIAVSGYYGFQNAGDEAILSSIFCGFSGHTINVIDAKHRFDFKLISNCDLLISGGGGLFQDKTSSKSFLYYSFIIWLAKFLGKKIYIFAQSIGPINKRVNVFLLQKTLDMADLITVRDQKSFDFLMSLKLKNKEKITRTADPTFMLDSKRYKTPFVRKGDFSAFIGICPRRFKNMPENFENDLAYLCDELYINLRAKIFFIPFQEPHDKYFCRKIMSKMNSASELYETKGDFGEILGITSQMDLILGMRLHSLLFAVNTNTPAISISYDPKVSSFMSEVFLQNFDVSEIKNTKEIINCAKNILNTSEGVKRSLETERERLYTEAKRNFKLPWI